MNAPLSLRHIGGGYSRRRPVLRDVTLVVARGSITGLLGRNGAGKTTLMHTALGLRKAWHGSAELFGHDAWDAPPGIRKRVGFVPQDLRDFHWMRVSQCVRLVASFYGDWDEALVAGLQRQWGLRDERIGSLSPGLRQRVAVLLAVGHRPELLVLDEPVASLDPGARRDFLRLVVDLNAQTGQTVLLSSHVCTDIERICSDVAICRANTERFFKAASPAFKTPEIGRILRTELVDAGFHDVEVRIQAGADTVGGSLAVLRNMASYAGTFDAMPAEEIAQLLAEAEAAVEADRYLFSLPQFVVTGRRP